jgi:hypothetical protein
MKYDATISMLANGKMAYESVDKLQNALGEQVFHYAQDKKKQQEERPAQWLR